MMPFAADHRLGRYQIRSAAESAFAGEVYRARNVESGGDVYLRVLTHTCLCVEEEVAGMRAQLGPAFALAHPHVLPLLDIGCSGSVLFAVSEFQEGETLRRKLHRARLPRDRASDFAIQIARGLIALHRAGVLHGDLKPEHVLIAKDGVARLMDGGLAALTYEEMPAEPSGSVPILIADYASPEQVRGERETWASDLFSWGVMLHEMLSGTRPFLRPTLAATTRAILSEDVPELQVPALDRIIRQATRKNPGERFDSARDLAFAMESFGSLTTPGNRIRKTVRERQTVPFLIAIVMFALGLLLGAAIAREYLRPTVVTQLSFRPLTFSGHDSSPAGAPDGKSLVFVSNRDGTERIWTAALDRQNEKPLTTGPDHAPRVSPDGRSVLFIRTEGAQDNLYSIPFAGGKAVKLLDNVQGADWSPHSDRIAWVRVAGEAHGPVSSMGTVNTNGAAPDELTRVTGQVLQYPRWSPDAKYLAASLGNRVLVLRTDSSGQQRILSPPPTRGSLSSVAWVSPDQLLYFQSVTLAGANGWPSGAANIIRQNVETGTTAALGFSQQSALHLDRLRDGSLVFDSSSGRKNLEEVSLTAGTSRFLTVGDSDDQDPAYSAGGKSIYFSSFRGGNLEIWRAETTSGAFHRAIESQTSESAPCLTFDGARLLWSSSREGHFEVYSANAEGAFTKRLTNDGAGAEHPSVSATGDWVVYHSTHPARAGIWKIRQSGLEDSPVVKGDTQWPEISPDGKYVLYTQTLPGVRSIRVATLEAGAAMPFHIDLPFTPGKSDASLGKAKWMPQGHAIAFIGEAGDGASGVYSQPFANGAEARGARTRLTSFDSRRAVQSFAVSPDGTRVTIASWELGSGLVQALNVPGAAR